MLEASNLGQIIGRLLERAGGEEAQSSAPVAKKHGMREQQVLDLVREKGEVRCADVVAGLGMTAGHTYVVLSRLRREGRLVRGTGKTSYRLP